MAVNRDKPGGGLYKLEPSELGNVDASAISVLVPVLNATNESAQLEIFG